MKFIELEPQTKIQLIKLRMQASAKNKLLKKKIAEKKPQSKFEETLKKVNETLKELKRKYK